MGFPHSSEGKESEMKVLATQSSQTLCDPRDCGPPVSSVHGIVQARMLRWVAMPSSRRSSQLRDQKRTSHVSCIGRQVLYHPGSPCYLGILIKEWSFIISVFLLLDGFT